MVFEFFVKKLRVNICLLICCLFKVTFIDDFKIFLCQCGGVFIRNDNMGYGQIFI